MFPRPARPMISEEKTSGMTVRSNRRRNNWPIGSVMLATNQFSPACAVPNTRFAATPAATPIPRPQRILLCLDRELSKPILVPLAQTHFNAKVSPDKFFEHLNVGSRTTTESAEVIRKDDFGAHIADKTRRPPAANDIVV